MEFTDEQKAVMDTDIANLRTQFEELPATLERKVIAIEAYNAEIKKKMSEQFEQILENLQLDSQRLLMIETELKITKELDKRQTASEHDIIKLKKLEDQMFQAHCFLERTLPMFVHH